MGRRLGLKPPTTCDSARGAGAPRARLIVAGLTAAFVLGAGCTAAARYRLLTFFFTGVPEPGQASAANEIATPELHEELADAKRKWRSARSRKLFVHLPYARRQCGECHVVGSGRLTQSLEQGLCQTCHFGFPGDEMFIHGPVAVNACGFCHHPHGSEYSSLLYADATSLCLRCHKADQLTSCAVRERPDERSCIDCHNPHSGGNRFFLK
ncbi:MAG: hypothetical protein KJ749_00880 [Planctomycetes bacterium]|nr:hypothetical protein [Planctomycetota bacterium]